MTSRLFPLLFFWELSESSLLLAESLRAEREDDEGLFASLGVFLSSPGGKKQVCDLGDANPTIIAIGGCGIGFHDCVIIQGVQAEVSSSPRAPTRGPVNLWG